MHDCIKFVKRLPIASCH